jgi:SHS2 domain-containing protein
LFAERNKYVKSYCVSSTIKRGKVGSGLAPFSCAPGGRTELSGPFFSVKRRKENICHLVHRAQLGYTLPMSNYTFFDHTADIGVEVTGRTRKELFVNAAEALFDVMIENKIGEESKKQQKKITVEGTDIADLLINFLREILYLFNGEKFITGGCEIIKFTNQELQARLTGESFNSKKHLIKTEIKAVTYSGLTVKKEKAGWKARIIFDV